MSIKSEDDSLYDVAIVGAGLAGSSIAATLANLGWRVLLVERDSFPRHKVCGEFISPEAQATLRHLGLFAEVAALKPVSLHATAITSRHARVLRRPLPGEAWGLSRYKLDEGLARAAVSRGVELRTATTVTSHVVQNEIKNGVQNEQVELHLRDRQQTTRIHARAAIMAFGRTALPGLAAHRPPADTSERARYVGIKCHYRGVEMPPQVELYFFPGGYAGLNPVEGGHVNLCLLVSYAAFAQAGRSIPGMLATAIAGNAALAERMHGAEAVVDTECSVAPVDTYRRAQPWSDVAQVGDSAVMIPPLCGDGMAMALRSAELCAPLADQFLRGNLSLAAWSSAYQQHWSQEFGQRVRIGRWIQQLLQIPMVGESLILTGNLLPSLADYFISSTRGSAPTDPLSLARGSG